jgi:4-amino-4-deoxy-L-arabinose transferase-like glycosyltransferase
MTTTTTPIEGLVPVDTPPTPPTSRRPRWELPAFGGLLAATAVLYLVGLSASGYANSFYSAAAQAGSRSWWAFLWGASDAGGSITVDKPPASLWVMGLSVRIFGLSSWSVLVPQALMGVATVALLYRIVRRHFSAGAALLAGAAMAVTPVAALMFRFNNPDALLVLLLVAAVWATLRAIDGPRTTRWMALAGAFVGLAFLTKQLQAFLVLPGLAVAFLWAAPVPWLKRLRDGFVAVGAMVVAAGWWVALIQLWPAASRPFVGGSQTNSFLQLTFGYNGFGRLTGSEVGSVGGGAAPGGGGQGGGWGATGITRMFSAEAGGQIAWLIPAALMLGVAGLWALRRAGRTSGARAQLVVWLAWLLVTGLTFSYMAGIFHAYYTVALAPAIAALVGIGAELAWRRRAARGWRLLLAGVVVATGWWSWVLLGRSADWNGWLRWVVLTVATVAGLLIAVGPALMLGRVAERRVVALGAAGAVLAGLAGPLAYTVQTVSTAHTGSIVSAGPTVAGATGFGGPGGFGGRGGGPGTTNGQAFPGGQGLPGGTANGQGTAGGTTNGAPGGTTNGQGFPGGTANGQGVAPGGGGMGGLLNGATVSSQVATLLEQNASSYRWAAATTGSQNAASYQLATQASVMPIGGFNGSDPSPTLAQFQAWVAAGDIHWYIAGSGLGRSNGGSDVASQIQQWVESSFTATTVDGVTLYDLTAASSSGSGS